MSENEFAGEIGGVMFFPFDIVSEELEAWVKLSRRISEYLSGLLEERNTLKRENKQLRYAIEHEAGMLEAAIEYDKLTPQFVAITVERLRAFLGADDE